MNKFRAIWRILFADKIAVFTWKEAAPDPTWLTVPTFSWVVSDNWSTIDLSYIRMKVEDLLKFKKNDSK